ncbi:MAG: rhomboid family intramembrane serine protease [Sphingobacteriales bacterium]|nr:rhomboid family intramembrane serine protease [Sphingobacteriales bacterium]
MIFPIGDQQVQRGYVPFFSYSIIAVNILIFIYQLFLGESVEDFINTFGAIPVSIVAGNHWYSLLSSMFLHGGWAHLVGNMMFLWVFGDNIEATIGNIRFFVFYLAGGIIASLTHIYFNMDSDAPMIGASGAIAAVLGAYLILFPHSRIKMLVVIFFYSFYIRAVFFLLIWIVQQIVSVWLDMNATDVETAQSGGVAWWAHIGGFAFGVAAGLFFKMVYPKPALMVTAPQEEEE